MKIKKIGIITGAPYVGSLRDKILLISSDDRHYGLNDDGTLLEQSYLLYDSTLGYLKATEGEITRHWSNIAKHWEPQSGDQVIITQNYQNWFMKPGVIVEPCESEEEYWQISNSFLIRTVPFNKEQMILSPNHGWNTEIEGKPKDITSDKSSKYHPDVVDELRKLDVGLVDLINARVYNEVIEARKLNTVLGGGFSWPDSPEGSSFWGNISNLLFEKKYEEANEVYRKLKNPDDSKFSKAITEEARNLDENLWKLIQLRINQDIEHCEKLWEVLDHGFVWAKTKETDGFWYDIYKHLQKADYSEANQSYNNFIQKSNKDKVKIPEEVKEPKEELAETVVSNFEIGEVVKVQEPCVDSYKARIIGMSPIYVEIEVNARDYPEKFDGNLHVLRKHVQHSCIHKLPMESVEPIKADLLELKVKHTNEENVITFNGHEVRVGDIVSFTYFDTVETRVRVTQIEKSSYGGNMPFRVEGKTTKWPSKNSIRDFVNHSLEDCSEDSLKGCSETYSEPYTVPMTTVKDSKLENAKFKFPIGASVRIIHGIHKDCFGIVRDHKTELGVVFIGVEINSRDIYGSTLNGKIETTNGWYVEETDLIRLATIPITSGTSSNAQISTGKTVGIQLPTIPLQKMFFTGGNGTNNLFIGDPSPAVPSKNYDQEPIKIKSKPKKQFTIV